MQGALRLQTGRVHSNLAITCNLPSSTIHAQNCYSHSVLPVAAAAWPAVLRACTEFSNNSSNSKMSLSCLVLLAGKGEEDNVTDFMGHLPVPQYGLKVYRDHTNLPQ